MEYYNRWVYDGRRLRPIVYKLFDFIFFFIFFHPKWIDTDLGGKKFAYAVSGFQSLRAMDKADEKEIHAGKS